MDFGFLHARMACDLKILFRRLYMYMQNHTLLLRILAKCHIMNIVVLIWRQDS